MPISVDASDAAITSKVRPATGAMPLNVFPKPMAVTPCADPHTPGSTPRKYPSECSAYWNKSSGFVSPVRVWKSAVVAIAHHARHNRSAALGRRLSRRLRPDRYATRMPRPCRKPLHMGSRSTSCWPSARMKSLYVSPDLRLGKAPKLRCESATGAELAPRGYVYPVKTNTSNQFDVARTIQPVG